MTDLKNQLCDVVVHSIGADKIVMENIDRIWTNIEGKIAWWKILTDLKNQLYDAVVQSTGADKMAAAGNSGTVGL